MLQHQRPPVFHLLLDLAVLVVLTTGCRPKEAAYIVWHKSIRKSTYMVKHQVHTYEAFVPADYTKTKHDYLWLLP